MVIQLVSEKDAYCTVMGTPSKSLGCCLGLFIRYWWLFM